MYVEQIICYTHQLQEFDYLGSHFAIIIAFMPILLLFIASTKKKNNKYLILRKIIIALFIYLENL